MFTSYRRIHEVAIYISSRSIQPSIQVDKRYKYGLLWLVKESFKAEKDGQKTQIIWRYFLGLELRLHDLQRQRFIRIYMYIPKDNGAQSLSCEGMLL